MTTITIKGKDKKSVDDYFKLQGRFRHLKPEQLQAIQAEVDRQWIRLLKKCEQS